MPRISLVSPRPGKTTACQSNDQTFNLRDLYEYGKSVNESRSKGKKPAVLRVKTQRSLFGKPRESLSTHDKHSPLTIDSSKKKGADWLLRTLKRDFANGPDYGPEVEEAWHLVWNAVVWAGEVAFDDAVLAALKLLSETQGRPAPDTSAELGIAFSNAIGNQLRRLGNPEAASKICRNTTVNELAQLLLSLPPQQQNALKPLLLAQSARHDQSALTITATQLLAALKWSAAMETAPPSVPTDTSDALSESSQTSDESLATVDATAPLGRAFAIAFSSRLKDLCIVGFPTIDEDNTVRQLARHIRQLPNDQQRALKEQLQIATHQSKPELATKARELLTELGWEVPADAARPLDLVQATDATGDAPERTTDNDGIGWRVMNALQALGLHALSVLTQKTTVQELADVIRTLQDGDKTQVQERLGQIHRNAHGPDAATAERVLDALGVSTLVKPAQATPVHVPADEKAAPRPRDERLDFFTAQGINQALRKEGVEFPEISMHTTVPQFVGHLKLHPEASPVVLGFLSVPPQNPVLRKSFTELATRIQAEVF